MSTRKPRKPISCKLDFAQTLRSGSSSSAPTQSPPSTQDVISAPPSSATMTSISRARKPALPTTASTSLSSLLERIEALLDPTTYHDFSINVKHLMNLGRKNGKHLEPRRRKLLGIVERNPQIWKLYEEYVWVQREGEKRLTYQLPRSLSLGGIEIETRQADGKMEKERVARAEENVGEIDADIQPVANESNEDLTMQREQDGLCVDEETNQVEVRTAFARQEDERKVLAVDESNEQKDEPLAQEGDEGYQERNEENAIGREGKVAEVDMPDTPTEEGEAEMLDMGNPCQRHKSLVALDIDPASISSLESRPFEESPFILEMMSTVFPTPLQSSKDMRFSDDVVEPAAFTSSGTMAAEEPEIVKQKLPGSPKLVEPMSPIRPMSPPPPGHRQVIPVTNPEAFPITRIQDVQTQNYPSAKIIDMSVHRDGTSHIVQVTAFVQNGPVDHLVINDARIISALGLSAPNFDVLSIRSEYLRMHETFTIHVSRNHCMLNPRMRLIGELRSARHAYLYWLDSRGCADPRGPPWAQEARRIAIQVERRAPDVWKEIEEYWKMEQGPGGRAYRANRSKYLGEDPMYGEESEQKANKFLEVVKAYGDTLMQIHTKATPMSAASSHQRTPTTRQRIEAVTSNKKPNVCENMAPEVNRNITNTVQSYTGATCRPVVFATPETIDLATPPSERAIPESANMLPPIEISERLAALSKMMRNRLPVNESANYEVMLSNLAGRGHLLVAVRKRYRTAVRDLLEEHPYAIPVHNRFARRYNKNFACKNECYHIPVYEHLEDTTRQESERRAGYKARTYQCFVDFYCADDYSTSGSPDAYVPTAPEPSVARSIGGPEPYLADGAQVVQDESGHRIAALAGDEGDFQMRDASRRIPTLEAVRVRAGVAGSSCREIETKESAAKSSSSNMGGAATPAHLPASEDCTEVAQDASTPPKKSDTVATGDQNASHQGSIPERNDRWQEEVRQDRRDTSQRDQDEDSEGSQLNPASTRALLSELMPSASHFPNSQTARSYLAWLHHRQRRFPTAAPNYSECILVAKRLNRPVSKVFDEVVYHWGFETGNDEKEWYKTNRLTLLGGDPSFNGEDIWKWGAWLKQAREG